MYYYVSACEISEIRVAISFKMVTLFCGMIYTGLDMAMYQVAEKF